MRSSYRDPSDAPKRELPGLTTKLNVVGNGHYSVISLQSNGSTNRKRSSRRPEHEVYAQSYHWRLLEGVASHEAYIIGLHPPV